ncbi:hypothetical protein [Streptomyces spectabilis]|uniref:Uncharacterized protein n=1 Tax=Streptomyces spectabilis TaxID=68270 RepID=A0A7W8B5R9_STRST|nr:hypothetical protein [Streptomyces spectabilis]MBB5109342.1 hypothetical protein [Streptomyces spectabilis]GGV52518.1 hypothetical protein GCM10010245_82740 [Streptomyces spectabilis]
MHPNPHTTNTGPRPFADQPHRLQQALHQARRTPFTVQEHLDEHTAWGWMRWALPDDPWFADGDLPLRQIGIRPPDPTLRDRCAYRWLTRRAPARIELDHGGSVTATTLTAALAALVGLVAALKHGIPAGIALPLTILLPLLADHLPARLDARARRYVRTIDQPAAVARLRPLIAWHIQINQTARHHPTAEQRHAARLSHRALWQLAALLTHPAAPPPPADGQLAVEAQHLADLAHRCAEAAAAHHQLEHAIAQPTPDHPDLPRAEELAAPSHPLAVAADTLKDAATASRHAAGRLHQLDASPTDPTH